VLRKPVNDFASQTLRGSQYSLNIVSI